MKAFATKGIAISTLLGLIIAAIILILFAPMLIKAAGAVWDKILTSLGLKSEELEEYDIAVELFEGIRCAYYRCEEGCGSENVKDEKYEFIKCKSEFCDKVPDSLKTADGKVCDWKNIAGLKYNIDLNSRAYPVRVEMPEMKKFYRDEIGINFFEASELSHDECSEITVPIVGNRLFLDESLIEGSVPLDIKEAVIKSGTMYVWATKYQEDYFHWRPSSVIVCAEHCHLILNPEEEKELEIPVEAGTSTLNEIVVCFSGTQHAVTVGIEKTTITPSIFVSVNHQDTTELGCKEPVSWVETVPPRSHVYEVPSIGKLNITCLNYYPTVGNVKFAMKIISTPLLGDVNGDCIVNQTDLDLCSQHFHEDWPPCDLYQDGIVDIYDLAIVSHNIGYTCTSPPPVTSPPPAPPA